MTDLINCVIVDDEPVAREGLEDYVSKTDCLTLVDVCENIRELSGVLEREEVDLVFLDIQMPGVSGLRFLKENEARPGIIITTAFTEYAIEGYDLDIIDYLLKPIPFSRFTKAVNRAKSHLVRREDVRTSSFFVRSGNRFVRINIADILYIECLENYQCIYLAGRRWIIHQTMKKLLEKLPEKFVQTHRSYIVAADKITAVGVQTVHIGPIEIPISRQKRRGVIDAIRRWQ